MIGFYKKTLWKETLLNVFWHELPTFYLLSKLAQRIISDVANLGRLVNDTDPSQRPLEAQVDASDGHPTMRACKSVFSLFRAAVVMQRLLVRAGWVLILGRNYHFIGSGSNSILAGL